MRLNVLVLFAWLSLLGCSNKKESGKGLEIQGTWQLISATTIERGTSQTTDYSGKLKMIKMFNNTHFAF
jgi:hypothetical protein